MGIASLLTVLLAAGCGQGPQTADVTLASPSVRASEAPASTDQPVPASERPVPAEEPVQAEETAGQSAPRELGQDEDARIGQPYDYQLFTHCGIVATWWNGRWWNAEPPLSDGNGNPPPGWGNPHQDGVMVQISEHRLEFTGDEGQHAVFVPRPPEEGAPPPCD